MDEQATTLVLIAITAGLIAVYLNVSATAYLLRDGPAQYERGQLAAQVVLIWIAPFAGALLVMYFLAESARPQRRSESRDAGNPSDIEPIAEAYSWLVRPTWIFRFAAAGSHRWDADDHVADNGSPTDTPGGDCAGGGDGGGE